MMSLDLAADKRVTARVSSIGGGILMKTKMVHFGILLVAFGVRFPQIVLAGSSRIFLTRRISSISGLNARCVQLQLACLCLLLSSVFIIQTAHAECTRTIYNKSEYTWVVNIRNDKGDVFVKDHVLNWGKNLTVTLNPAGHFDSNRIFLTQYINNLAIHQAGFGTNADTFGDCFKWRHYDLTKGRVFESTGRIVLNEPADGDIILNNPDLSDPTLSDEEKMEYLLRSLVGLYTHTPPAGANYKQNGWHIGRIERVGDTGLEWSNKAGSKWTLYPAPDRLLTDHGNPYYGHGRPENREFNLVLRNNRVVGFHFNNGFYQKD